MSHQVMSHTSIDHQLDWWRLFRVAHWRSGRRGGRPDGALAMSTRHSLVSWACQYVSQSRLASCGGPELAGHLMVLVRADPGGLA